MKKVFLLQLVTTVLASIVLAQGNPPATNKSGLLVDTKGMTLYSYDSDGANATKSACTGSCSTMWPAYMAPAGATKSGDFNLIANGKGKQWTYKGNPLYFFVQDKKTGDKIGDNMGNVWHIVK